MKEKTKIKLWSMDIIMVGTEESGGVVIQKCSVNTVFWKTVQNSQENNCAEVSFE